MGQLAAGAFRCAQDLGPVYAPGAKIGEALEICADIKRNGKDSVLTKIAMRRVGPLLDHSKRRCVLPATLLRPERSEGVYPGSSTGWEVTASQCDNHEEEGGAEEDEDRIYRESREGRGDHPRDAPATCDT